MADVTIANTSANLSAKTIACHDVDGTTTAQWTFNRGASAPFAVNSGAGNVTNLDADKVDGQDGAYYRAITNLLGVMNLCHGRLTLTTALPVTTSDVTGATTLYFTPIAGGLIALFDGASTWNIRALTELSIAVPASTSQLYDVFVYDNSGTPALELLAWTNDTTRATALTTQNGVLVKTGVTTRRYVGSMRTTTVSGQTEDSATKRYVWNYYNRVQRLLKRTESTSTWTYASATVRQANAAAANQVDLVVGVAETCLSLTVSLAGQNSSSATNIVGIGEDSTTTIASDSVGGLGAGIASGWYAPITATMTHYPAVGRHFYAWLEASAAGTATFASIGGAGIPGGGLTGFYWG